VKYNARNFAQAGRTLPVYISTPANLKLAAVALLALTAPFPSSTNMFDPANLDDDGLPLTIRAVFVICPQKKIKLILRVSPRASVHPFIHPFIHPSAVATVSNFSNHWIVGLLLGLLAQSTQRLWAATWTSSAAASRRCNCLMSTASPLPQTGRTCVSRLQLPPLRFAARFVCD
jgi:hypothetical protein